MSEDAHCLFCQIVRDEVPAERVWESEQVLAFRDVNPQAPTHVLVVPRQHHRDLAALSDADPDGLTALIRAAAVVASQAGLADGYRLVFNTGAQAGQSVFHCHGHVLGGRALGWPPG